MKTANDYAKERRARGLCCSCSKPSTRGGKCDEHWKIYKGYAAKKYQERQAAGLCGMCGKNPAPTDKKCCDECRTKQNSARDGRKPPPKPKVIFDKSWRERNIEAGLCAAGGKNHGHLVPGVGLCQACIDKWKDRRAQRINKNLCPQCGINPPSEGKAKCGDCRAKMRNVRKQRAEQGICTHCGKHPPRDEGGKVCSGCLDYMKEKTRRLAKILKDSTYAAYGGYKCACCGETEKTFLQIDHMNNDGWEHRQKTFGQQSGSGGGKMYRWLRDNGFPPGFQVLCANCNTGKHRNGGCCPHKLEQELVNGAGI